VSGTEDKQWLCVLELLEAPAVLVNDRGDILARNTAARSSPLELRRAQHLEDIVHADDLAKVHELVAEALS
jgi:hypothetical protein